MRKPLVYLYKSEPEIHTAVVKVVDGKTYAEIKTRVHGIELVKEERPICPRVLRQMAYEFLDEVTVCGYNYGKHVDITTQRNYLIIKISTTVGDFILLLHKSISSGIRTLVKTLKQNKGECELIAGGYRYIAKKEDGAITIEQEVIV